MTPYDDAIQGKVTRQSSPGGAICFVLACGIVACGRPPGDPGAPPTTPSPLFRGAQSYETIEQATQHLPSRSTWKVFIDSKSNVRERCPRFDEFTFDVPATDLGHAGTLRLQFINDRLSVTVFIPNDFPAYLDSLRRAGTALSHEEAHVPPATLVWSAQGADGRSFVGWRDERFYEQINAWIERCS